MDLKVRFPEPVSAVALTSLNPEVCVYILQGVWRDITAPGQFFTLINKLNNSVYCFYSLSIYFLFLKTFKKVFDTVITRKL